MRLAFFISGRGSNMEVILDAIDQGHISATAGLVLSNKADALGLTTARERGISAIFCDHRDYESREDYDHVLIRHLQEHSIDAVILAGFMRILSPVLIREFEGKMLNIHPSLLPKYPGLHTHKRALDAGDTEAGATVHFVIEELDAGAAVLQARVPIKENDDVATLSERVLQMEHIIYPLAVKWLAEGRIHWHSGAAYLDQEPIPEHGVQFVM